MNPIKYIEATCEWCGEEITNKDSEIVFAILRNGDLLCESCGLEKADLVLKWFTVKIAPYGTLAEMEDIEVAKEEPEEPEN